MKSRFGLFCMVLLALGISACGTSVAPAFNANGFGTNPWGTNQNGWGNQNPWGMPNGGAGNFQGGCVPVQSGTIPFTIQGARMSDALILGGNMPWGALGVVYPGTYGQSSIGGGNAFGGQGMVQFQAIQNQSGQLQMSVSPNGGTVSGMLTLGQNAINQLLGVAGNMGTYQYSPYQNQFGGNGCVSSVAIHVVHKSSQQTGTIWEARVFIYMNNSQFPVTFLNF